MTNSFNTFLSELCVHAGGHVVSIYQFGSHAAKKHTRLSDRDLLIVAGSHEDTHRIATIIEKLEKKLLHHRSTRMSSFLERHLMGTTDLSGIHMVIIGYDEFMKGDIQKESPAQRSAMRSVRLKLLTTVLISRSIFLHELKQSAHLLHGKDILKHLSIPRVSLSDRIKTFSLSAVVLILTPLAVRRAQRFKVWCFKASKYYASCMESYAQIACSNPRITYEELGYDSRGYRTAKQYRYQPGAYRGSLWKLYCFT